MTNLSSDAELKANSSKTFTKPSDEFEKYLKRQCMKTTFNGLHVENFGWYQKMFGLV